MAISNSESESSGLCEGFMDANLRPALQKLVSRFPSLALRSDISKLLSSDGGEVHMEEIMGVFVELFLEAEYTVALVGCFRSHMLFVMNNLVETLQRLLSSTTRTDEAYESFDAHDFARTRWHQNNCWSLKLHEYVVIALSRSLELLPFLLRPTLRYFSFAPRPFERLLQSVLVSEMTEKELSHLLDTVRACYRFLHVEPAVFSELWDWSPFLELLKWTLGASRGTSPSDVIFDIRWCAVQALAIVLKASDEATREMGNKICGLTEEQSFTCLLRWEDFCQDVALEKASWYLESKELDSHNFLGNITKSEISLERTNKKIDISSLVSCMESFGIDLSQMKGMIFNSSEPLVHSFVMTPNMKQTLQAVIMAISQGCPVLLEGPTGTGKTMLIKMVAHITGKPDVLFIHLDDQTDSKTLLGSYVCTEIPGEFKWKPGSLTQAVIRGLWVVFEEIDKAPSDVLSILSPVLEEQKLHIPGRAEGIATAEGFQLFATVTKNHGSMSSASSGWETFSNLWRKILMGPPSNVDLLEVVKGVFPELAVVSPKLIDTLNMLNLLMEGMTNKYLRSDMVNFHQRFSMRDLMKWCKRLQDLNISLDTDVLSTYNREQIFCEAIDIFASRFMKETRRLVMRKIADLWNISEAQIDFWDQLHRPRVQENPFTVQIGRIVFPVHHKKDLRTCTRLFSNTGSALRSLERIACSVKHNEPILLVGETGTGKTTLVQNLAIKLGMPLTVLNLSQQSDSTDLLGGFKPINAQSVCIPLIEEFMHLFSSTFSTEQNAAFLSKVKQFMDRKKWHQLLLAFQTAVEKVSNLENFTGYSDRESVKRKKSLDKTKIGQWKSFSIKLQKAQRQIDASNISFAFSFVEGALVKAMRAGHWLLLDEINLAPPETLQRLVGVLEGGSLCLTEKGDVEHVPRDSSFRIFACMNPATDIGKPDLPYNIKNRFTEIFIDELLNTEDLSLLVHQYLEGLLPSLPISDIVNFYLEARKLSETQLFDGANQKPQYSLRSLARALEYTRAAAPTYGFKRALYDGMCMLFLTLLDQQSASLMEGKICSILMTKSFQLDDVPQCPGPNFVRIEQYWVEKGTTQVSKTSLENCKKYVLTKSIRQHLKNLARAVFIRNYPVLLQGPTSSGKTSLIEYLATVTGHRFVRINNHEHTDLQEYLGSYVAGPSGKMVFHEGILIEAMRNGYWIVLDELNLAPSDVLEALNRLLDDNRELFVPELQTMVKPHPHFMLFATQNPPGIYGGRKALSRAFRNRFLEIYVSDIPEEELCTILAKRCELPESYAKKMVEIMKDLQRHRQSSKVFAGKHGFITPRDLFRWAGRFKKFGRSYEDLAMDGYMLLAERLRDEKEKAVVQEILERHLRVKIDLGKLYPEDVSVTNEIGNLPLSPEPLAGMGKVIWTKSLKRLFYLVHRCYEHHEPVLLVGETGSGKTTACQLLSFIVKQNLITLNCHQHTETSDFLGGYRPVRERSSIVGTFQAKVQDVMTSNLFSNFCEGRVLSDKIEDAAETLACLGHVISVIKEANFKASNNFEIQSDLYFLEQAEQELYTLQKNWQSLFLWHDGPLVEAMKNGHFLLIDEISLADDSVLERLNSVLEPSRILVLAEKGGPVLEELVADPNFFLLATMNPGGDFGKKELSPALRNRFTEIWVPTVSDPDDLRSIVVNRLSRPELLCLADPLLSFWKWFHSMETGHVLTVRDLLSWIMFINATEKNIGINEAFIHGASLVLLDGLGSGKTNLLTERLRGMCLNFLWHQLHYSKDQVNEIIAKQDVTRVQCGTEGVDQTTCQLNPDSSLSKNTFGIEPFYIQKGSHEPQSYHYALCAPTTSRNVVRLLRAMQLSKPVLLEGSPGVGKTSLVAALANASKHNLVRINLSEQTDIMDLLGSDLPVEGSKEVEFQWSDGILLQALKAGSWVVLDELNLAPQSVLEGLNAILDHRGEVYIPELGHTYRCPPSFRVFACQNPSYQGSGRKCLPKSFLNRFTKVFVDELQEDDFLFISSSLYPSISKDFLSKLIKFNSRIYHETMIDCKFGQHGAPWEFNLRDILRCCSLIEDSKCSSQRNCFLNVVYLQRMRTNEDRCQVLKIYEEVFCCPATIDPYPKVKITPRALVIGEASLRRNTKTRTSTSRNNLQLLPGLLHCMESIMYCVQQGWMCILIGSSSGKTSTVRLLAELTGNKLHEYNLSEGTDTSELLGCFEQFDAFRCFHDVMTNVHDWLVKVCATCLGAPAAGLTVEQCMAIVKELLGSWAQFQNSLKLQNFHQFSYLTSGNESVGMDSISEQSFGMLMGIVDQLRQIVCSSEIHVNSCDVDIEKSLQILSSLKQQLSMRGNAGHFAWFNGGLIEALERGEWVVLENANLCNPTVLDRLNSLLEPNGLMTVNERGLVNGKPFVVSAHKKFRLFLTVNPAYGEVSRAMRNRGVEIFLMHPQWLTSTRGMEEGLVGSDIEELRQFLILHGVPVSNLIDSMAITHSVLKRELSQFRVFLSLRELSQWIQLFVELLRRGANLSHSFHWSWEQVYIHAIDRHEARVAATCLVRQNLSNINIIDPSNWDTLSLCLPGGWPNPLQMRKFLTFSKEATVERDCLYIKRIMTHFTSFKLGKECKAMVFAKDTMKDFSSWIKSNLCIAPFLPSIALRSFFFPNSETWDDVKNVTFPAVDVNDFNTMLYYGCEWIIDQAFLDDIEIRLKWLKWHAHKLASYCQALHEIAIFTENVLSHPITKRVISILNSVRLWHFQSMPCFSLDAAEQLIGNNNLDLDKRKLRQLLNNFQLLRLTMWQWKSETCIGTERSPLRVFSPLRTTEAKWFDHIFKFLRVLEDELLLMSTNLPDYNIFSGLYKNLQEAHQAFWKVVDNPSSDCDELVICCQKLKKIVSRFSNYLANKECNSKALECFYHISRALDAILSSYPIAVKPLLWKSAGHPMLPSTPEFFYRQKELFEFCRSIWPKDLYRRLLIDAGEDSLIEIAASTNVDFRHVAMEGVAITVCMNTKVIDIPKQNILLECNDILKMLTEIYDTTKKLLLDRWSNKLLVNQMDWHCVKSRANIRSSENCEDDLFSLDIVGLSQVQGPWIKNLLLSDHKGLCMDLTLLVLLSEGLLPSCRTQCQVDMVEGLRRVISFGLRSTSRSPLDFIPYQKLLWLIDAHASEGIDDVEYSSTVHDMWFGWHSALWNLPSNYGMNESESHTLAAQGSLYLFGATQTIILLHIMNEPMTSVKDHSCKLSQLRVTSAHFWHCYIWGNDLYEAMFSTFCALFKQMILVHCKSLKEADSNSVKALLDCMHYNASKGDRKFSEVLDSLISILEASDHMKFRETIHTILRPFLQSLQSSKTSSDDEPTLLYGMAHCWLMLGGMRLKLLVDSYYIDPVRKHLCKHSQLTDKLHHLELKVKVRRESEALAKGATIHSNCKDLNNLEILKEKVEYHRHKIVYRPEPSKFKGLHAECVNFMCSVADYQKLSSFINQLQTAESNVHFSLSEVQNWQEISASFISRLSEEYDAFKDIIQPVQLAIYEMKFGLSLAMKASLQKSVYSTLQLNYGYDAATFLCFFMEFPTGSGGLDLGKVSKMISATLTSVATNKEACHLLSKVKILCFCFRHTAKRVLHSHVLDNSAMQILNAVLSALTYLWVEIKDQDKGKANLETQTYQFKARNFSIEDRLEITESAFNKSLIQDIWESERQSCGLEGDFIESHADISQTAQPELGDDWESVEECVLQDLVRLHCDLFRFACFLEDFGRIKVSNEERLRLFSLGYSIGIPVIQGAGNMLPLVLDEKLMPSHLLRLCLEHKKLSEPTSSRFNIYKDPNTFEMSLMVEPIMKLQDKVKNLLTEYAGHPVLQNILNVIGTLLAIPVNAPLIKTLLGVQYLIHRSQTWEENAPRHLSLSGELSPLCSLLKRWRKIEFECWPALLDSVDQQHAMNADKLWFALYSVLFRKIQLEADTEIKSSILSVEEFMQTATIGEYGRRLDHLLAFHGQISATVHLKLNSSGMPRDILLKLTKITYNAFGYYSQFLPFVNESIASARKAIERELKDYSELCKWQRNDYYSIETFKNTHQKLQKFIRKYNDVLLQPVMELLNQKLMKIGSDDLNIPELKMLENWNMCEKEFKEMNSSQRVPQSERVGCSENQLQSTVSQIYSGFTKRCSHDIPVIADKLQKFIFESVFSKEATESRQEGCRFLLNFSQDVLCHAYDLRNDKIKRFVKEKTFENILDMLKSIGLSRHKSAVPKEFRDASNWFLQPSFKIPHLRSEHHHRIEDTFLIGISDCSNDCSREGGASSWTVANTYYFKNMTMMQRLHEIRHHFHKDLRLSEVEKSMSFLEHLFYLQQKQRCTAYEFLSDIEKLSEVILLLKESVNVCVMDKTMLSRQQHFMSKWVVCVKDFVDNLCNSFVETLLLLNTMEDTHNCLSAKLGDEIKEIKKYIDRFSQLLDGFKVSLDECVVRCHVNAVKFCNQSYPVLVSGKIEEVVHSVFAVTKEMQSELPGLLKVCSLGHCQIPALDNISKLLDKGVELFQKFKSEVPTRDAFIDVEALNSAFLKLYNDSISDILISVQNLKRLSVQVESGQTLQACESKFETQIGSFRLTKVHNSLLKMISAVVDLFNSNDAGSDEVFRSAENMLRVVIIFGDSILHAAKTILIDYMDMHKTVAVLHYALSNVFAALYLNGFLVAEDQHENGGSNLKFEDAGGTGMGEGEGLKDVSDQIDDEDQLLGSSKQSAEEALESQNLSSTRDKGIEMEQDFATNDVFSVSEDSDEGSMDDDDDNEANLDSQMGETGNHEEVVDEKLWSKEDCQVENPVEKYETGASVQDMNPDSLELRAKQDINSDETETEPTNNEKLPDKDSTVEEYQDAENEIGTPEESTMNQENAYADPTGTQPQLDEKVQPSEAIDMEEATEAQMDVEEESSPERNEDISEETRPEVKSPETNNSDLDANNSTDLRKETQQTAESGNCEMQIESSDLGKETEQTAEAENCEMEIDSSEQKQQSTKPEDSFDVDAPASTLGYLSNPNVETDVQDTIGSQEMNGFASNPRNDVNLGNAQMQRLDASKDVYGDDASALPTSDISNGVGHERSLDLKSTSSIERNRSFEKMDANPLRSIGDSLKGWKERVKLFDVKSDPENETETRSEIKEMEREGGNEFQYVSEREKSYSQALGAATTDQLIANLNINNSDTLPEDDHDDMGAALPESDTDAHLEEASITEHNFENPVCSKSKYDNKGQKYSKDIALSLPTDNEIEIHTDSQKKPIESSDSLVFTERNHQLSVLNSEIACDDSDDAWTEEDVRKMRRDVQTLLSVDTSREHAATVWRKIERLTTRLSHELAEQLRLIMEPTLASRLQGDYQTGKRINMKKIIPYIASHFRKDKIWLRRTKPNKRQYQVVLAIDDSRSMSESNCGHMALEALVTICRALSQLEVGQLAVASFGEKGNIRLLHDFDQPFSSEAGLKIISNFSFKQDNTIVDEPVVDLLKYLITLLDHVAMSSRGLSGRADVQQLVLIIADGRFHEKENLRRCVRDALSRKQLLAFIVLDSSDESILDVQSVSFAEGTPKFSKYIDSFPFPYYIILKDIESLPRTLADLLKQWFELTQYSHG